jgi:hypothetical protein
VSAALARTATRAIDAVVSLARDEGGQGTTEYILVLTISVMIFAIVSKQLIKPAFKFIQDFMSSKFNSLLFGADPHVFPVHR